MKRTMWMLPVMLVILSGLTMAQSLSQATVKANVPFDFMVNNKIIPAGECAIGAVSMNSGALLIRNADAKKSAMSAASHEESGAAADSTVLVFRQYGSQYFLSSIRLEGSNLTYELPESKAEVELRAQNAPASQTTLLASLQ